MEKTPKMMTIREVAKTGILPEHALRQLVKEKRLPVIHVGKKAFINYTALCEQLDSLEFNMTTTTK